jgi:hypothetical protein
MPIRKDHAAPNHAAVGFHVLRRVEIDCNSETQFASCMVQSWVDEDGYTLSGGLNAVWTSYVPVPLAGLPAGLYKSAIETYLVTDTESPFVGGSIVDFMGGPDGLRLRKWANIKQTRAILLSSGVTWDGDVFDSDAESKQNILGAISVMQTTGLDSMVWTLADNRTRTLTLAELTQVGAAIGLKTAAIYDTARQLREQVFDPAKTTAAEVEAVGWPT